MILKAAVNDVVCKVGVNLLVKFKDRGETGVKVTKKPKTSDFNETETDVSVYINKP